MRWWGWWFGSVRPQLLAYLEAVHVGRGDVGRVGDDEVEWPGAVAIGSGSGKDRLAVWLDVGEEGETDASG